MPPSAPPSTVKVAAALLTVYAVWGSTYLAIAVMVETLPPLLAAGVRFVVAGLLMLAFLWARGRSGGARPERVGVPQWRAAAIVGILLLLGGNGFVVLAELRIPSGIAAVLIATVPIWLALFDAAVTRHRPSALAVGGIVAGFVGVAILLAPVSGVDSLDPIGVALVLIAAISWAIGSIYSRNAPMPRSALLGTGMEMLAGGIALLAVGGLLGEAGEVHAAAFSIPSLLALGYLIVFGSLAGFTAYVWLLGNVPIATAGTYAYVNPIVAVGLGALVRAEPITPRTLIAVVIIIAAVVAMVSGRRRSAEGPGPLPEAASVET
jgi:drug/metabolite transporter (DMT)-like permease